MKKTICFIVLMNLILSGFAFAYSPDITGWQKIEWGMTKSMVANAYETVVDKTFGLDSLKLKELYYMDDKAFTVHFIFDKDNIIKVISIQPAYKTNFTMNYEEVVRLIINKYGQPSDKEQNRYTSSFFWIMANGHIQAVHLLLSNSYVLLYRPKM